MVQTCNFCQTNQKTVFLCSVYFLMIIFSFFIFYFLFIYLFIYSFIYLFIHFDLEKKVVNFHRQSTWSYVLRENPSTKLHFSRYFTNAKF